MKNSDWCGFSFQGLLATIFLCIPGFLQGYLLLMTWSQSNDENYVSSISDVGDIKYFEDAFRFLFLGGEVMGALFSFIMADRMGRRSTLVVTMVSMTMSLIFSLLAFKSSTQLMTRSIVGLCTGVLIALIPNYLSEFSIADRRGRNMSIFSLFILLGSGTSSIIYAIENTSNYVTGYLTTLGAIIISFIILGGIIIIPESPRWLSVHATRTDVLRALRSIRIPQEYKVEFTRMNTITSSVLHGALPDTWIGIINDLSILYRILLMCIMMMLSQCTGIHIITSYGILLTDRLAVHDHTLILILAEIAGVFGYLVGYHIIDKIGRRFLLVFGSLAIGLSWLGAVVCIEIGGLEQGLSDINTVSLRMSFLFGGFLCLFSFCYSASIGIVLWTLPPEIFPIQCRAKAMSIIYSFYCLCGMCYSYALVTWFHKNFSIITGIWSFTAASVLLSVFAFFLIPETTGLPLETMGSLFANEWSENSSSVLPWWYSYEKMHSRTRRDIIPNQDDPVEEQTDTGTELHNNGEEMLVDGQTNQTGTSNEGTPLLSACV